MTVAITMEARNFTPDVSQSIVLYEYYGKGTVVNTSLNRPMNKANILGFRFEAPAGDYELRIEYAARASRPCSVTVNEQKVLPRVLEGTTGGWYVINLQWVTVGKITLVDGQNVLQMEPVTFGPIPHIHTIKLIHQKKPQPQDLTRIEGVGAKIAGLLKEAGITTYADLGAETVEELQAVLDAAGHSYATADPGTWPEQAGLAATEKWDELKLLQGQLKGGRRES